MAATKKTKKSTSTKRTASKSSAKSTAKGQMDWNWEDFRPEWANEGLERITSELEKWNDELQSRSSQFRDESQKRIEESIEQVQAELRKIPAIKRAEELRGELEDRVEKNIETGVDAVYTRLKLARLDEVKALERKISRLNSKLRALEKKAA
ncbi:MAG: phasin family protein [Myxococcota bacterium]